MGEVVMSDKTNKPVMGFDVAALLTALPFIAIIWALIYWGHVN